MNIEQEIDVLKRQVQSLRKQIQQDHELLETIASPPWKRLWWLIRGYKLWKVGRWYGNG
jgi:hypothetical protein